MNSAHIVAKIGRDRGVAWV